MLKTSYSLSDKIKQKLLDQLYHNSKKSVTALLILSMILTYFMSSEVPAYKIYPWFILIAAISISRLYDAYYYSSHDCSNTYGKWYRSLVVKALLSAALWGMVPFLFLSNIHDENTYLLTIVILLGLSSGATASFFPDMKLSMTYLLLLVSPLCYYMLGLEGIIGIVYFSITILYIFTLFSIAKSANHALVESYKKEEDLSAAKNELRNLFQQTPIGVFYFDTNLRVLDSNAALSEILRSTPEEMIGYDLRRLPDQRPMGVLKDALKEGTRVYRGPYKSVKGRDLWIEVKCSPLTNEDGKVIGGVGLLENKTKEKEALDELEYMAKHDELTSLLNRRSFREYMYGLIADPLHTKHYSVLFYLDLNQFKQINDSMGHTVGDELLVLVAERLKGLAGQTYVLSRLGGDEFTIIMPYCAADYDEAHQMSVVFGQKVQKLFVDAFLIDELHLYIKSSIGIVIIEPGTTNIEELIRYADISMYQAKREGSSCFAYYNLEFDQQRKALFRLQHDLSHAIAKGELEIFYQPIVHISDKRVVASEALLRWNHPAKGLLTPAEFIDLAIESGVIDDIGWYVIENVCRKIADWKSRGMYKLTYISININAKQLQRYRFAESFFKLLERYEINPSEIRLEITERSLIDNFEQTNWIIKDLQKNGIKCAIDDFGIGYSSLSYLQKLAFSTLKIDREFIKDILTNTEDRFLVESIIMIAKRFNYKVVVEGIESEDQRAFIKNIDPEITFQGYLFSSAVAADEFEKRFLR